MLVAVYGPAEVKLKDEIMDKATVKVIFQPKTDIAGTIQEHSHKNLILFVFIIGTEEREKEVIIRKTMENVIISSLHPRTLITIVIQVLHDDGSVRKNSYNSHIPTRCLFFWFPFLFLSTIASGGSY